MVTRSKVGKTKSVVIFGISIAASTLWGSSAECPYPVDSINSLIKKGEISQAYLLSKKAYSLCGDNAHGELYAKLAWWNHHPYEAYGLLHHIPKDSPLYQKIYAAKILADLRNGKTPKIPSFLNNHYDILIERYRRAMREKRFSQAYALASKLYRAYPNREARSLQALSLMAMKRYKESLAIYRSLGDTKRIHDLEQILLEQKLQKRNDEITVAWRGSNRPLAKKLFDDLSEKEQKLFREKYPINTCRVESLHMAGIGAQWVHHDDHRYRDRSFYVEGYFPVDRYTIYAKAEHTERYQDEDQQFSIEIYPPGWKGTWGYLSLTVSDQGGFYSDYSAGIYLYHQFGEYEVGGGYRYSHYQNTIAHLVQLEATRYLSDFMTIRGVAYYELVSGSYAFEAEWRYRTPCHVEWRVDYIYSHSKERLSDTVLGEGRSHKLLLGVEYPISRSVSVGGELSWERHFGPNHYTSYGINVFIRKYW